MITKQRKTNIRQHTKQMIENGRQQCIALEFGDTVTLAQLLWAEVYPPATVRCSF